MRCERHDLLPGQCECSSGRHEPDYALNRRHVLRTHGYHEEAPQVSATIVVQPTTDELSRRKGHDIPTMGYGHWAVVVDRRAVKDLDEEREAARAAAERRALIEALFAVQNESITVTIR